MADIRQTLERLVGCQSFFANVERQFSLRTLDLLGICIVTVWLLSPLGGQAALRLLAKSPRVQYSEAKIHYLNSESSVMDSILAGYEIILDRQDFEHLYLVSLISPSAQQASPLDVWGNIKVPKLPDVLRDHETVDPLQWRPVDRSSNASYSSLIGIPVTGLMNTAELNFTMLSMYWEVGCPAITLSYANNSGAICRYQDLRSTSMRNCLPLAMRLDESARRDDDAGRNQSNEHFSLYSWTEDTPPEFQSQPGGSVAIANCTLGYREVESMVKCKSGSCYVDAMRDVTNTSDPRGVYKYAGTPGPLSWMFGHLPSMGRACGDSDYCDFRVQGSTKLEKWMNDTSLVFGRHNDDSMSLHRLGPKVVSEKLTTALNTLWQATYATLYLGGGLPSAQSELDSLATLKYPLNVSTILPATAYVTEVEGDVYVTQWGWIVLLLVASSVLQAAATTALILRHLTLSPVLLGHVSSQTRDNLYIALVPGGSSMDGFERTRMLRHLPVRIGDVRGQEDVGHIALAAISGDGPERVKKERLYN